MPNMEVTTRIPPRRQRHVGGDNQQEARGVQRHGCALLWQDSVPLRRGNKEWERNVPVREETHEVDTN